MLYPPKRAAKAEPEVVQLFLVMFYFWVRKRILDFQFTDGNSTFWNLENVLSPEGTLESRYRRRSNWFYLCLILGQETYIGLSIYWRFFAFLRSWKCFVPRRDSAKQSPMGAILILSILLWSGEECLTLSIYRQFFAFLRPPECFFDGTGWTGWTGERSRKIVL